MRQHLQQVQQVTAAPVAELITPPPPVSLVYLLHWFVELQAGRQSGFGGPQPITWADLAAWARLARVAPQAWELQALRRLDQAWVSAWVDAQPKGRAGK